eukprot:2441962-Pleurochrysis_carterae.AAC.2
MSAAQAAASTPPNASERALRLAPRRLSSVCPTARDSLVASSRRAACRPTRHAHARARAHERTHARMRAAPGSAAPAFSL